MADPTKTTKIEIVEVEFWRSIIRRALSDCSTVDFYDMSPDAVDNMALVAAQAIHREISS